MPALIHYCACAQLLSMKGSYICLYFLIVLNLNSFDSNNLPNLVPDQRQAYDIIIDSNDNNKGKFVFIDAPGGTGKTFLNNLLLAKVRSTGKLTIAVASSGIAATLLSGGKTAHYTATFKLPLNVSFEEESVCSIRKNGPLGKAQGQTYMLELT